MNSNVKIVVETATVTAAADKTLQVTDSHQGEKLLWDGIDDVKFREKDNDTLVGYKCDFNVNVIDPSFHACIKNYHWHIVPLRLIKH